MEAIILAGGLGTRLRNVVSDVPKCMAPIGSRPFLSLLLDQLARFSEVNRVIISVGYLREAILKWVEINAYRYPYKIDFAIEDTPLGTGGGIRLALEMCREASVLVLNGDTYFDINAGFLLKNGDASIVVALKRMTGFDRYGKVECDDGGIITRFCEKQYCNEGLINGGIYLINRSKLNLKSYPSVFSFEKDILQPMAGTGNLQGVIQDGYFIDIGIPDDYAIAQLKWGEWDTLLLDRDGVINTLRPGDYVKCWEEFEFRPGFLINCKEWAQRYKHIFVVTNQRGVGKGLMSQMALDVIHNQMIHLISQAGGRIDGIYVCYALDDSDARRKPNIGMWLEILQDYPDVNPNKTVFLGDSDSDMAFAKNAGIYGIKINW